jgi:hypothetical protein
MNFCSPRHIGTVFVVRVSLLNSSTFAKPLCYHFSVPTILLHKGFRLFFFSNEGNPREPVHVHVRKGGAVAKFWVDPEIMLASAYGMNPPELKELEGLVKINR